MKTITLTIALFLICILQSNGQTNPISNLTWEAYYVSPYNYFELKWDEPASPHDELIGYNVYREDDLYRFQTETSLYNFEDRSNCGVDFLIYEGGIPFYAHVTAVYNPGPVESAYTETVYIEGAAIKVENFEYIKTVVYPNPSKGIINIENEDLNKIQIYDVTGKKIRELNPQSQIDLTDISKGIYFMRLISDKGILVNKIILE